MTNTRTQSNLRLLKSRNQREGWYYGKKYVLYLILGMWKYLGRKRSLREFSLRGQHHE